MSLQKTTSLSTLLIFIFTLVACGSSAIKQRKEQRDKMMQTSKLYCEFVNGEVYANDIDVALNIEMARRCDSEKPFTISQYKTPSESQGILYCCSIAARANRREAPVSPKKEEVKTEAPQVEEVEN